MKKPSFFDNLFRFKKKAFAWNASNIIGVVTLSLIIIVVVILASITPRIQTGAPRTIDLAGPFKELHRGEVSDVMFDRYTAAINELDADAYDKASLLNLGYIYRSMQEYGEAEKAFRRYLEKNTDDAEALLGLARIYTDQGRYADAETKYYEITDTYPLYTIAYENLLDLYETGKLPLNQKFATEITDARAFDEANAYEDELRSYVQRFSALSTN